jgi:hypothetical protein
MTLSYGTNGWVSSVENQAPFSVPTDCQIGVISFTKNPSPLDDQPTGIWIGGGIGDIVGTTITALEGSCTTNTQAIVVNLQYQTEPGCSFNNDTGSVTLIAASNAGGPFTYYVDGAQQSSSVVFGLSVGSHTAQAIDSNGNDSDIISFEILNSEPFSIDSVSTVTNTAPTPSTMSYVSVTEYPNLPEGSQITTTILFNIGTQIYHATPTSIISSNYSTNFYILTSEGTQQIIPISLISSESNSSPWGIVCGDLDEIASEFESTNPITINSGDKLIFEITYDWAFESETPFNECTEIVAFNSLVEHISPTITEGCYYLNIDNYVFKLSSLIIQRQPISPVSGVIVQNAFGPE